MISYCESSECRRHSLLSYFNQSHIFDEGCGNCDVCINPPVKENGNSIGKKILSAVLETGEMFGQMHIIDILRGAKTQKIQTFGHNQIESLAEDLSKLEHIDILYLNNNKIKHPKIFQMDNQAKVKAALIGGVALVGAALEW